MGHSFTYLMHNIEIPFSYILYLFSWERYTSGTQSLLVTLPTGITPDFSGGTLGNIHSASD